jgi:glutathione S-transferase
MAFTIEQTVNESGVDLTTIKVKLKYPTNKFELFAWEFCPYSLKTQLAFEYKTLEYKDLEYSINLIAPYSYSVLKELEVKTNSSVPPIVKVQYKQGIEESWINNSNALIKLLDSLYPQNQLLFAEDPKLGLEIAFLNDWINESFRRPFFSLLYLNKANLQRASNKWLGNEESIFCKIRLELYKINKVSYYKDSFVSPELALEAAYKRFDEELLPLVTDKLELSYERGNEFLTGKQLTIADLSLYSFLKQILSLDESNLINRRSILVKFMEAVENIPLNKIPGNEKKGYTRHKISLLDRSEGSIQAKAVSLPH